MSRSSSIFTKDLALAIWTPEVLRERSVMGKPKVKKGSAEYINKPCLTPEKKQAITRENCNLQCMYIGWKSPFNIFLFIGALAYHLKKKGMTQDKINCDIKKINKFLNEKIQDLGKPPRPHQN